MTARGLPLPSTPQGPWSSGVQPGEAGGVQPRAGPQGSRRPRPPARCLFWVPDLWTEAPPCLHQASLHSLALSLWEA